jgi:hypothetical protein
LAAIGIDNTLLNWQTYTDQRIYSLSVINNMLFMGGEFNKVNDVSNSFFSIVDSNSGEILW